MDYSQLWNSALSQIEIELSRVNFNTWFKNTRIIDYKEGEVTIGVPNEFVKDWLNQNIINLFLESYAPFMKECVLLFYRCKTRNTSKESTTYFNYRSTTSS